MPELEQAPSPGEVKAEKAVEYSNMETLSGLRLPAELEKEMDSNYDAIPEGLKRREAERRTDGRDEKGRFAPKEDETPPEASDEQPEKPVAASSEAASEASVEAQSPAPVNPGLEAALVALRLEGVPDSIIKTTPNEQLLKWGAQAKERQAKRDAELRSRTEELKKAQEAASKPTEKAESEKAPTVIPELDAALPALKTYGEDFARDVEPVFRAAVGAALKQAEARFSPTADALVAALSESQAIIREMLDESMVREFGEGFPEPVRGAKLDQTRAKVKELWGEGGKSYSESAATLLGRYRACWSDAARLSRDPEPKPRDQAKQQRQAQGLPSSPGKKVPSKPQTLDDEMDRAFEEAQARWASR